MDLRARVVVPKSHERSHEFREGARHGDVVLRHSSRHRGLLRVHRGVAEHERPFLRGARGDSTSAESRTTWEARTRLDLEVGAQRGSRRVRPGVLGPQRRRRVRELDLYHQVQLRRQHLPAAQGARHGGAQQHVRVAALVHRAGRPGVLHLCELTDGVGQSA